MTYDDVLALLDRQRTEVLAGLGNFLTGSDSLSALVGCVVANRVFKDLQTAPSLDKWIVSESWSGGRLMVGHSMLIPYTTSMDAMIPGEDIVMLAKQHVVPGSEIERWCALQNKSKIAYLANDRILACRLAGLYAY